MSALTPAHSVLRLPTGSMNSVASSKQVSLIHASGLSDHSASNHLAWPCCRFCTLPLSSTGLRSRSWLRHSLAGSPLMPGRIEFVILRTGRSPPAAPHHASLRRSCSWLQAGERLPEEDFHLSDHLRFQAHECGGPAPLWSNLTQALLSNTATCFHHYVYFNSPSRSRFQRQIRDSSSGAKAAPGRRTPRS
jgi:hypothetical protein